VCLEVTETAVVDRSVSHITLERLKQVGIRLAIDDFGVGQSSLSQLAHLRELSCPIIQGWLYSRALVRGDFVRYATAGLSSGEWSAQSAQPPATTVTTTPR
jgi:sensor c-di-GMP phosphodiesterase-like protein